MFDLKQANIYQAIKREKHFGIIANLKWLFLVGCGASFVWFLVSQTQTAIDVFLGLFSLFIASKILEAFFESRLKKPIPKARLEQALLDLERFNLAEFFGFEPARAFFKAFQLAESRNLAPSPTTVFYFVLKDNPELRLIFIRALLDFEAVKNRLKKEMGQAPREYLQEIILDCLKTATERGCQLVSIYDLLIVLCEKDLVFKEILIEANLLAQDIKNLIMSQESLKQMQKKKKRFWEIENLLKMGSIGRDWAAGYTIALDQYSIDWTDILKRKSYGEIIGHEQEIERLETVLSRETSNNALLVGEPGSGRKSIVQALTKKILFGRSLASINYKRVVELDLGALLAKAKSEKGAESILELVFQEAVAAGNIIMVIDRFPDFVAGKRRPGAIDISGVILKYLRFPQLQVIGICDFAGFHKYIEQNPSVSASFEKIEVLEISEQETILVLQNQVPFYEIKYKRFISYPAVRDIVGYCTKYLPATPFPKKALDLLDEVMVYVSAHVKERIVLPRHIAKIVTEKTKIPVGEIEAKEREVLLSLESLIHQKIINQDEAVSEVAEAMRRARAEITIRKGPIGAFLFLGPTGVGKTETSKALAEIYFGSETRMIRLDMSEFQDIKDIPRLIGAPEKEGLLTTQVTERPFSLILLDEIEKAHSDILNLFLQVLDEGHLTDGVGRKVSFKNTIIIATSNAGYQIILKAIKEQTEWSEVKPNLLDHLFEQVIFRPEFINRFDAVIVFRPLTKQNLLDIAQLMLETLKKNLAQKHIEFEIIPSLKQKIVEIGYSPIFGAREMRRAIQNKVENVLARALLSGEIKRGDRIQITENFEIIKI